MSPALGWVAVEGDLVGGEGQQAEGARPESGEHEHVSGIKVRRDLGGGKSRKKKEKKKKNLRKKTKTKKHKTRAPYLEDLIRGISNGVGHLDWLSNMAKWRDIYQ